MAWPYLYITFTSHLPCLYFYIHLPLPFLLPLPLSHFYLYLPFTLPLPPLYPYLYLTPPLSLTLPLTLTFTSLLPLSLPYLSLTFILPSPIPYLYLTFTLPYLYCSEKKGEFWLGFPSTQKMSFWGGGQGILPALKNILSVRTANQVTVRWSPCSYKTTKNRTTSVDHG